MQLRPDHAAASQRWAMGWVFTTLLLVSYVLVGTLNSDWGAGVYWLATPFVFLGLANLGLAWWAGVPPWRKPRPAPPPTPF